MEPVATPTCEKCSAEMRYKGGKERLIESRIGGLAIERGDIRGTPTRLPTNWRRPHVKGLSTQSNSTRRQAIFVPTISVCTISRCAKKNGPSAGGWSKAAQSNSRLASAVLACAGPGKAPKTCCQFAPPSLADALTRWGTLPKTCPHREVDPLLQVHCQNRCFCATMDVYVQVRKKYNAAHTRQRRHDRARA